MAHLPGKRSVVLFASALLLLSACREEARSPERAEGSPAPRPSPSTAPAASSEEPGGAASHAGGLVGFDDARAQTVEFMGYYDSIQLTAGQQRIKEQALRPLPAACCSEFSALTCCCECNLSRSVWGLTHHLIAKGYGAEEVRSTVQQWLAFVSPAGHSGRSCATGRCGKPFAEDGCGGMSPSALVF